MLSCLRVRGISDCIPIGFIDVYFRKLDKLASSFVSKKEAFFICFLKMLLEGLEPPASRVETGCSVHLSYKSKIDRFLIDV